MADDKEKSWLIPCPSCEKEISRQAVHCPSCGEQNKGAVLRVKVIHDVEIGVGTGMKMGYGLYLDTF